MTLQVSIPVKKPFSPGELASRPPTISPITETSPDVVTTLHLSYQWRRFVAYAIYTALDNPDLSDAVKTWAGELLNDLYTAEETEAAMIGSIFVWPNSGATIPANCVPCDGTEYPKVTYPELYAVLGVSWETDATHFVVPDLRGRVVVGKGGVFGFGETGGEATHELTISEIPAHSHGIVIGAPAGDGGRVMRGTSQQTNQVTESAGGGEAHENMPPYLALVWIIVATDD